MKLRKTLCILAASLLLLITGCSREPNEDVTWYMKDNVRTFFGGQTNRQVYEYNEDWSTSSVTMYDNEVLSVVQTYEITETGYILRATQDGVEETLEVVVTKDENGNVTHTEQYANGVLTTIAESTYDAQGNLLTYTAQLPEADMTLRQEFTYDSQGNKIRAVSDSGYGASTTEYTYDSQSRLVNESSPDSNSWTEYTYSNDGKVQTALYYDENGELSNKSVTTYDNYGNVLTVETYDAEGNITLTSAFSYISTDGRTSSGIAG